MTKCELTIKQFIALARKELADYMSTVKHSDDAITFPEWTSENGKTYQKEYGVYYSDEYDMWMYSPNNTNFPGMMYVMLVDANVMPRNQAYVKTVII